MTDPFDHGRESDTRAFSLDGMDHADLRVKHRDQTRRARGRHHRALGKCALTSELVTFSATRAFPAYATECPWSRLEKMSLPRLTLGGSGSADRRSRPQSGPEPPLPGVEQIRTASGKVEFVEFWK